MSTLQKSKFYPKFLSAKDKVKSDSKESKRIGLRIFLFIVRWLATILSIYCFSAAVVAGVIPFTVSYLAGASQMTLGTDVITGLSSWVFPALGATIIISIGTVFIDIKMFKFFKKYLSFDGAKEQAEKMEENTVKVVKLSSRKK